MKLISAGASPFARKVHVLLHETGQTGDVEVISVMTTPVSPDPQVLAANPLAKIPALIREDGPALYDSRVITRYLDARGDCGLYPEARLWEVLTLEATADAIMDAAILLTYEKRLRPEEMRFAAWQKAQWSKVAGALAAIEQRWMSHLSGPLDMAQIATACALSYLDFRHDDRNWRQGHDALAAWHKEFAARDSMIASAPE